MFKGVRSQLVKTNLRRNISDASMQYSIYSMTFLVLRVENVP